MFQRRAGEGVSKAQGAERRAEAIAKLDKNATTFQAESTQQELLHGLPIIRTFLIPKTFHDEYTDNAVSESQVEDLGTNPTMNVDKAKEPNQYGVRAGDVKQIQEQVLPGSLVSFVVDDEEQRYKDPRHGTVRPMSELAAWLGMPLLDNLFVPPMRGNNVASVDVQAAAAATAVRALRPDR